MIEILEKLLENNPTVLILGFGREGRSTFKLLRKYFPTYPLGIADKNEAVADDPEIISSLDCKLFLGNNYLDAVADFELIFKAPGVSLKGLTIDEKTIITSQSDVFLSQFAKQTIGVTGTKGKSTTVSLIHHFLTNNGVKSVLLGNIGIPPFDKLDEIDDQTTVVFEMSANQLELIQHSPHIAVLLNLFPEHLDHFTSLDKYYNAKINIGKFQNENDILIAEESLETKLGNHKSKLQLYGVSEVEDATIGKSGFYIRDENCQIQLDKKMVPLLGTHNLNNLAAAMLAVRQVGVGFQDSLKCISSFKTLPHRLEFVGNFSGIDFYNDSISTIPESAIAALESLSNVDTIILGGFDRGIEYKKLVDYLVEKNISNLVFLGKAGDQMMKLLPSSYHENHGVFQVSDLAGALQLARINTKKGSICLLSPAAASYDQFHNFEHRGDVFKELVRNL